MIILKKYVKCFILLFLCIQKIKCMEQLPQKKKTVFSYIDSGGPISYVTNENLNIHAPIKNEKEVYFPNYQLSAVGFSLLETENNYQSFLIANQGSFYKDFLGCKIYNPLSVNDLIEIGEFNSNYATNSSLQLFSPYRLKYTEKKYNSENEIYEEENVFFLPPEKKSAESSYKDYFKSTQLYDNVSLLRVELEPFDLGNLTYCQFKEILKHIISSNKCPCESNLEKWLKDQKNKKSFFSHEILGGGCKKEQACLIADFINDSYKEILLTKLYKEIKDHKVNILELVKNSEEGNSEEGNSEEGNSEEGNSEEGNSEEGNSEEG
jgi:hypothetical protein